jgi:hypothetical protein
MKNRILSVLVCVVLLFTTAVLAACANEAEALKEQIEVLEADNEELLSAISSLRSDLERAQNNLLNAQNELQDLKAEIEAANTAGDQGSQQDGPLAITSYGAPTQDFSWPLANGDFKDLGLRVNINEIDEDDEIIWRSTVESVFTVVPGEDGLTAILTPVTKGRAELVVTVGDQSTRSWVSIT